ncbi:MAG: HEAT repeat domain-containing protein [Provencibacterium sp.]|jgi:HEAT repeat protein|nr:HEAT repeat domain-containing protein [Provencibacterium sp.]
MGGKLEKIRHYGEKGKWEKLESFTKSNDAEIRAAAYEALGGIRKDESNNILVAGIADPDARVRLAVAHSLAKIGTDHNEEQIKHQLANESDAGVQNALREAMVAVRSRR